MRRDMRWRYPSAGLFPAMKGVFFAVAFPPGVEAGRCLVAPEPAQVVPDLFRLAEREPLMRFGKVEIGPERSLFQTILIVVRLGAALLQFLLIRFLLRNNPGWIQSADISPFVVGF